MLFTLCVHSRLICITRQVQQVIHAPDLFSSVNHVEIKQLAAQSAVLQMLGLVSVAKQAANFEGGLLRCPVCELA